MIDVISDLPNGVIGVRLSGKVTGEEYQQVLDPLIETALSGGAKISALIVYEDDAELSSGAMWQDTKLGLKNPTAWKRIALVSQRSWVDRLTPVMSAMMPGEIKSFDSDEIEAAKIWLTDAQQ